MNPFRHSYNRIVYMTGIALVLITLGIEYFQYNRHQEFLLMDLKNRLDEHTTNVNLRARAIQGYVHGLKIAAENALFYVKNFGTVSPLFPYLKNNLENTSYSLDTGPKIDKAKLGNLTGLGSIENLSSDLKNELNMALALNSFFEIALRSNRGAAWVYYTSKSHFQNLYPWIPSNLNPYHQAVLDKFFFLGATPENNPKQRNFWTPAYQDGAGYENKYQKGFVVTNSSPVYDGKKFLGSVSLDLSLTELNRVMQRFDTFQGALFLINKEHQVLATNDVKASAKPLRQILKLEDLVEKEIVQKIDHEIQTPSGWLSFNKSAIIYVKDLHEAPWFMIYIGSQHELFMQAFWEALEDIIIITAILLFVVGVGYLMVIRDFISPAQKLVDHITKENQGLKSNPENLPVRWRHWFDIVSRIFRENRTLLAHLENRVKIRTKQLQHKNYQLEKTLTNLKKAQNQIIVQEKLASLGALTAGIAHEIKNPLNFVINFSELSLEYLLELREKVSNENELFSQIEQNIIKTREHAQRADSIVKGMLAHARGSTGEITIFNLNKTLSESIELAYLGFQGKEHNFTARVIKNFDPALTRIKGSQQDLVRVFLNIVNNACFAMYEKQKKQGTKFTPQLTITTREKKEKAEIIFEDNGVGINQATLKKIFIPFFTTKDSGKGTGLGLSLSYDIITHQHHGQLTVESKVGQYTRFIIELPKEV
ncbi:MAG: GHKL domain-containing protein [Proteobacteria bacterium]|nr:GHKL domain-containing protein [Pseudomonadota bacterium]